MQVSVIIVNFNTRELLRNCLNSIYSQTKDISFEVIVSDNGFVFYLNSDTLLLNNAIKIFYDYWKQHESEQLGALGCNLVDGENKVSHSYGYFPNAFIVFRRLVHHLLTFYRLNFLKLLHVDVSKDCKAGNYKYYCGDVDYVTGADLFVKNVKTELYTLSCIPPIILYGSDKLLYDRTGLKCLTSIKRNGTI